jgi:tripeptide aminopeptidase
MAPEVLVIDNGRLVATFLELVAIDSPSGEEAAIAAHISGRLESLGADVRRDAYGNLIAVLGSGGEPFLLGSHLDTVEPGRGVKPVVEDGVIRTDGKTVLGGDAKAGIAAIVEGLTAFVDSGRALPAVEVVLTRGEEGGLLGSANLDYSMLSARAGVEFDGEGPVNQITTEAPGRISAEVHFTGRGAHAGAEPEKGISAIHMATRFITGFPQGRIDEETTANIGMISGGTAPNAVPENTFLSAEARSRDPAKLAALRDKVLSLVSEIALEFPEGRVRCDLRDEFGGYRLPPEHPLLARVTGAMRRIGLTPLLLPSGGATDANNFARHGIEAAVVGLGGYDFHTVRESIPIANLEDAARFCFALLEDLAGGS